MIRPRVSRLAATALLAALRKRHPDEFVWNKFFDVLAGGPWLRERIDAGTSAARIVRDLAPLLLQFDGKRPKRYHSTEEMLARGESHPD